MSQLILEGYSSMLQRFLTLLLFLSWALAACGQSNQQGVESDSNAATQTVAQQKNQDGPSTREPGCTVVGGQPAPSPTEQAIIPTPGLNDWSMGPDDAYVTFIEYSDFQ
jgi:hypothetical protein